jgi:hypothetical protein
MLFNYVDNKENYIEFDDDNYIYNYYENRAYTEEERQSMVATIPEEHWFTLQKVKVYVGGNVEIIGSRFFKPRGMPIVSDANSKHIAEYTDGSAIIEFREKRDDPLIHWEGVLSDGRIINYESSKTFREGYGNLSTGSDFDSYDKAPVVNKWLARSWIEDGEEELIFLVENREMLDNVAAYYSLPIPYNDDIKPILDGNLQAIRIKSLDLDGKGPGKFVAVVVASIVFEDNVATKFRLYKTSRWNE